MQPQFKFIIPQKLEDLLHPQEDLNIFYVNDELTSLEIAQKLPETESKLKDDPLAISEEFGTFFSVLKNFKDIDPRTVDRTWTLAFRTTDSYKEQLRDIFNVLNESAGSQSVLNISNSQPSASQISGSQNVRGNLFESLQEKLRYVNGLKMLVYLDCTFIQLFEDALSSESHRQNFNENYSETATPAAKRKKKQQRGTDVSFKDYDKFKQRVLKDLLELISMPIDKLTDSLTEARDIAGQIMRICYTMIENSSFNNFTKNKDLMDIVYTSLGYGIEKYNQSLSFCIKFMQLLQYKEQLAPLLAELAEHIVTRHNQRLLIGEILREIDRIDVKGLSGDSSCPRAISTFLIDLSERCPEEFIPFLNHMFGYLNQDSYIMRNASMSVMANLLMKVIHQNEDKKALRDELLNVLLRHIRDITGYTRSRVLALWSSLSEKECIPNSYIALVTGEAVGRLHDKSCLVRKNALRFIISILSNNPFAKKLNLKKFQERYEEEKQNLDKLLEEENPDDKAETLSQSSQMDSITSETEPETVHPNLTIRNFALAGVSQLEAKQRIVAFLKDSIAFTKHIHEAIPIATEMLVSKNITDIQEAIDFFVHCHEYSIDEAFIGFKRMILLINKHEKSIRDTISAAYKRIFFESSRYAGKSNLESLVVQNFINFVQTASIDECLSLELLLGQFLQSEDFTDKMVRELWSRYTKTKENTTEEDSIAAIQLLGMLSATQPDIITHNFQLCFQHGLSNDGCSEEGSRLVRETCIAIRKSLPRKIEEKRKRGRLSKDEEIFARLSDILVNSLNEVDSENWFSMCDELVGVIFDLAENPDKVCSKIYDRMAEKVLKDAVPNSNGTTATQDTNRQESPDLVFQQPSTMHHTGSTNGTTTPSQMFEQVNSIPLARFIHFLGDVALDLAVYLELHVLLELKIRNASKNQDTSIDNMTNHNISISRNNISISNRRRSRKYGAPDKTIDDQNLDEEIGLAGAEAEDVEMEAIGTICDEEIVCGDNMLAKLSKLIIEVVVDPRSFYDIELKLASSLALAKFMMVSARFCRDHLRLLFTVLEKCQDPEVKINLLIAISDLCIRFPNQLDGWTGKIFDCLQSEEVLVRRAALLILSRLVLCDILKAKDQISTMANLIVDDDPQIASYSRHFFLELSKKLNAIYNVLPDIISRLSDSKTGISEKNFRIVMRFIFELIDKSHHIDRLVDKLCGRFMETDDERHWSDLAFCLTLLKYSDKSMTKLFDKFDCYKDKLCIDSVHESFTALIANYRKTPHLRNEMKQMLDEFEAKMAKSIGEQKDATMIEEQNEEGEGEEQDQDQDQDDEEEQVTVQETSKNNNSKAQNRRTRAQINNKKACNGNGRANTSATSSDDTMTSANDESTDMEVSVSST